MGDKWNIYHESVPEKATKTKKMILQIIDFNVLSLTHVDVIDHRAK